MHDLVLRWDDGYGEVRVTPNGQASVFDMIRVLGGKKNPRRTWAELAEAHPEVVRKTDNLKFPGPGQRETPVAKDKAAAFYILGLLPGTAGRAYREQSAKLFAAWLDSPEAVVSDLIQELDAEGQKRIEARLRGIRTRNDFTDALKELGVQGAGFAWCTNAVYEPVIGASAQQLKLVVSERTGIPVKQIKTPRDFMDIQELSSIEFAERVAPAQARRAGARGNAKVAQIVRQSAVYVRQLLDGEVAIPGIS